MVHVPTTAHKHAAPVVPTGDPDMAAPLALSVVVPIYNEEDNISLLYTTLTAALADGPPPYCSSYELILVDDGSTDRTFERCADLQAYDSRVTVVQFRRNYGKTAALNAGFRLTRGARVVTIDADMQEDPADMFTLLARIDNDGDDMVSAWRKQRNDPFGKTLPSRVFNLVVSRLSGIYLHDFNCGFKAYRRDVIRSLHLYGDQHRFIPMLAHQSGFRVSEVPVPHQSRRFGKSKFGARRLLIGYLDFIQVLFLTTYLRHPLRLFGTVGTTMTGIGVLICVYLSVLWVLDQGPIGDRPLLILGVLMIIAGLQFISLGLVGEMLRHDSSRTNDEYHIRRILRADTSEERVL